MSRRASGGVDLIEGRLHAGHQTGHRRVNQEEQGSATGRMVDRSVAEREQGVGGLADGLDLMRGLTENFWDSLYPELEDGDAEMRATPLEWDGRASGTPSSTPPSRAAAWTGSGTKSPAPCRTKPRRRRTKSKAKAREDAARRRQAPARGIRRGVCGDQRGDRHSLSAELRPGL